jgi:hypothetical protein
MLAADVVRIGVMTYFIGRPGSPVGDADVSVVTTAAPPQVVEARR